MLPHSSTWGAGTEPRGIEASVQDTGGLLTQCCRDHALCRLKVAEFSAELGHYSKAVELYEEAAKRAVENNLLKFSARGYLANAGQCSCDAPCTGTRTFRAVPASQHILPAP